MSFRVKHQKARKLVISQALSHPRCPKSMDIVDRGGDGVKFTANTSNTDNLVKWWIRTIREAYPETELHDEGKYGHNILIPVTQVWRPSRCYVVLRFAMLRYAMLRYAMLHYVTLCYVIGVE